MPIETSGTELELTGAGRLHRLRRSMGMDRAVVFTIMARGWTSLAGVVTLTLIARFLSGAEQGYYYTFGSLVALQIVFELGFSFVILQMASHETAHLVFAADGTVSGSVMAHARLASVLQKSVQWYSVAAVLMCCTLIPSGLYFFAKHQQTSPPVAWRMAWVMVVLAASFAFQIDPVFSFMEGCGYVPRVAKARLWQAIVGSTLAWVALLTHHGLFAPAMSIAGQALAGSSWLWTQRRLLFGLMRHVVGEHRIEWITEVWPFQWRIAVSWMCGYFIFQLFVPVLFAYRGPLSAGQMGMSLSITSALTSIAISWVNTKAGPFGGMVARKDYRTLDQTFFRALFQSLGVSVLFSLTAMGVSLFLNVHHMKLATRMLSPLPFGILLATMVLNHSVFCVAIYLRAHKEEKMLWQSIYGAVATTASTYLFGKRFGAIGVVSGYFVVCLIGLGMAIYTFLHYRRVWHVGA